MALVLHEEIISILFSKTENVAILEKVFGTLANKNAINLPRQRIRLLNGVLHVLSAAAPTLSVLGYKSYTAFREGVRFVVMLHSAQDGQLLAIIEADWLGRMRTGGTSGLATKFLARPDATIVGLIGSGNQAVTQLMGVCAVRPISIIYVYSRNARVCKVFCDEMAKILNIEVRPVPSARQAVEVADILITATSSSDPVFQGEWLKLG